MAQQRNSDPTMMDDCKVVPPPPAYAESQQFGGGGNPVDRHATPAPIYMSNASSSSAGMSPSCSSPSTMMASPTSSSSSSAPQAMFPAGMVVQPNFATVAPMPATGQMVMVGGQQHLVAGPPSHQCQECGKKDPKSLPISSEDFRWCMKRCFCLVVTIIVLGFIFALVMVNSRRW